MTELIHGAWIQSPKPTRRCIEVATEVGLGGLTLCPLMPNGKGSLRSRYKPHDLLERTLALNAAGIRPGIMIWADTTPADIDLTRGWIRANEEALLACRLFEGDLEESYIRGSLANRRLWNEMMAEELHRLRSKGWEGEFSVTATQWDLGKERLDEAIRLLADILRTQWYVFFKPQQKKHWSHALGEPEAQVTSWAKQLVEKVLPRVGKEDLEVVAGLAAYWLRGVKGHKGSIPSAIAAAIRGAQTFDEAVQIVLWSLNWFDGGGAEATVRRSYAAEFADDETPEDDGADDSAVPDGAGLMPGERERVRELQRMLRACGYDSGIGGVWGNRTRDALQRWETDRRFAPDDWFFDHNGPQISALVSKMGLEVA